MMVTNTNGDTGITKCRGCGQPKTVSTEGLCRTCTTKQIARAADGPVDEKTMTTEANYVCPKCKARVTQLFRVRGYAQEMCRGCVTGLRGKPAPTYTETPQGPEVYMVLGKVQLHRGRGTPEKRVPQRFDGERVAVGAEPVTEAEIKSRLLKAQPAGHRDIEPEDINSPEFDEAPKMEQVSAVNEDADEPQARPAKPAKQGTNPFRRTALNGVKPQGRK